MLFCIAVRQAGMQPPFRMIHKKCIWTHSDPKNTSFGQRFAFICFIMIDLTAILKIMVAILKMEKKNAFASNDFATSKI